MPTGDQVTYVAGTGHRPIPMAADVRVRPAHKPWCERCKKTRDLNRDGHCEPCAKALEVSARLRAEREAAEAARPEPKPTLQQKPGKAPRIAAPRPTSPKQRRQPTLAEELHDLEQTDPAVAAAAASYDDMVARATRPDDHVIPGNLTPQGEEDAPPAPDPGERDKAPRPAVPDRMPVIDLAETIAAGQRLAADLAAVTATEPTATDREVARAAQALRATAGSEDPATRLLRLNALASIDALQMFHDLRTAPVAPPAPAGFTTFTRPPRKKRQPHPLTDAQITELLRRYDDGQTLRRIAAEMRLHERRIQRAVAAAGRELRSRGAGAVILRDRLIELGITARQVKEWAFANGHLETYPKAGQVSAHLVDLYVAAHPGNGRSTVVAGEVVA